MTNEEAIKTLKETLYDEKTSKNYLEAVRMARESLENQKTGHWRHYEGMLICSKCGAEFYDDIMEYCGDDVPKCCPDCGAKMQEVEE